MGLKEKIEKDNQDALRAADNLRRSVLSMVISAIHDKDKTAVKNLSDEDYQTVIRQEAKKRKDSIQEFEKAERNDLADKEKEELAILEEYLPRAMSEDELRQELGKIVEGLSEEQKGNFGRAMAEVMKTIKGRADGNMVRQELEELLGS